jgi:hypothetical protein
MRLAVEGAATIGAPNPSRLAWPSVKRGAVGVELSGGVGGAASGLRDTRPWSVIGD